MNAHLKLALVAGALTIAAPREALAKPHLPSPLWAGTWRLNLAQSRFTIPGARTELRSYRVAGNVVTLVSSGINPDGTPIKFHYRAAYDGQWYPLVGNPIGNRIALRLVNPRATMAKVKRDDRVTAIATVAVSADGKRLIMNRKTLNARGMMMTDTLAYDRIR